MFDNGALLVAVAFIQALQTTLVEYFCNNIFKRIVKES
jgi:hypothetical protein